MSDYKEFIVSLASYSKRINTLHICLESLFSQTIKPENIIVYLDNSVSYDNLPSSIHPYIKKGLEIAFVENDIKSHNKYYYSFTKYPNKIIITVDDDVVYERHLFENLLKTYNNYPQAICASRVHYMLFDNNKKIKPYMEWEHECTRITKPSMRLFATGVGGILYPPNLLSIKTLDKNLIMDLALEADDIWLKFIQILDRIPVVWSGQLPQHPPQIEGTKINGLYNENKERNDYFIQNLISYYNMDLFNLL